MRRALLLALLLSCPARAEVLVRWRTGPVPARDVLGVTALVVPAGGELERDARARGYRVYVEGDASLQINDAGKWPIQLVLRQYVLSGSALAAATELDPNQPPPPAQTLQMAIVVVATLPILLVYPFLQKYFTRGVLTGAIKG